MNGAPKTALVLSGGGVRGAYEVGIVQGIVEALALPAGSPAPFQLFTGTSVGAINSAFMVSRAERTDLGIYELAELWRNLQVNAHMRLNLGSSKAVGDTLRGLGRGLVDSRPLEVLVHRSIDWHALHSNLRSGYALALSVAAFDLLASRTTIFVEKHDSIDFRPSPDPTRVARIGEITSNHVLASAAIPLVFPARPLDGSYFCDGGIRFNTPISSAIRAGAERLVIVALQGARRRTQPAPLAGHPSPQYVVGKLFDALLMDPFSYDLEVMERFNDLFAALEEVLTPDELERVHRLVEGRRNAHYRQLKTLVFSPSADLGKLANEHLRENLDQWQIGRIPRFFLRRAALEDATWEADWAAYLMFEGNYAAKLIRLGLQDARDKADQIRQFFGSARSASVSP